MRQARSTRWHRRGVGGVIRTTLALLMVLLISCNWQVMAAGPVAELGSGHWAVGALDTLAKAGLVDSRSLPSGGSTGITRLEIALVVSQALSQLSKALPGAPKAHQQLDLAGLTTAFNRVPGTRRPLEPREIEALRRLTAEFAPELSVFGIRVVNPERLDVPGAAPDVASSRFVDLDLLESEAALDVEPAKPLELGTGPGLESGSELAASVPASGSRATPDLGPVSAESSQASPDGAGSGLKLVTGPVSTGGRGEVPGLSGINGKLRPEPVVNIENLGTLGSTSLLTTAADGRSSELNGEVLVGEQVTIGSALVKDLVVTMATEVNPGESRISAWRKVLVVEPTVKVSSEFVSGLRADSQAGAVEVQAGVQVGQVNLGANVRNVAGLQSSAALPQTVPDTQGYGLSLKMGRVTVLTGYEKVPSEHQNLRSIGLNYSFSQLATLKAGYQFVDVDSVNPRSRANAVLGVDVDVTNLGKFRAGLTLEGLLEDGPMMRTTDGQKASAGVELRLPWNARLTADYELRRQKAEGAQPNIQQTATLGLGYNFAKNATLLLGYRLIDFGAAIDEGEAKKQTDLTAGVSVRF